jgi:hypothetical protein
MFFPSSLADFIPNLGLIPLRIIVLPEKNLECIDMARTKWMRMLSQSTNLWK